MLLIQKPAAKGDVVTLKLRSAEEVIGRVDEDDGETITLHKPMTLTYGSNGIGLTNWIITADQNAKVPIKKEHIMVMIPSVRTAADQYIKATTGIETVRTL